MKKNFGLIYKELYNFLPKTLSLILKKYGFGIRIPGSKRHRIHNTEGKVQVISADEQAPEVILPRGCDKRGKESGGPYPTVLGKPANT